MNRPNLVESMLEIDAIRRSTDTRLRWDDEQEAWLEESRASAPEQLAAVGFVLVALGVTAGVMIYGAIALVSRWLP